MRRKQQNMMHLEQSEVNMYLSRIEIDIHNRQKYKDLNHVGAMHHWVEQSFIHEFETKERTRKLWRVDKLNGKQYLIIVSPTKPNLDTLEKYGVASTGETKDYLPFLKNLKKGMRAMFRVTLNPVISLKEEHGKRGRVVPHVTVAQQEQFLLDRSEKNGFTLEEGDFSIVQRGYVTLKKAGNKPINLSQATYEGILTISDQNKFISTLTNGIGRKKAYGFGMMTVIPMMNEE